MIDAALGQVGPEMAVFVAMNGQQFDALVVGDAVLRALPGVYIPVDDQHSFQPPLRHRPFGADGDVVEQTETAALVVIRVVTGWTDCGESVGAAASSSR